jgi:hypothetical protein
LLSVAFVEELEMSWVCWDFYIRTGKFEPWKVEASFLLFYIYIF